MTEDKKLVFLDIDGTLVSMLGKPSLLAVKAVREARAQGHLVFLCTGRNVPVIGEEILSLGFDGVIASAGAHVEVNGQVIFDQLLPEARIQECLTVFHREGVYCIIETPDGAYMDPQLEEMIRNANPDAENSELVRIQREVNEKLRIRSYDDYPRKGAYKICFSAASMEAIDRTRPYLEKDFFYVVHSGRRGEKFCNGEAIPHDIDKGKGIGIVCRYLQRDLKDTIAFGDSLNDYQMMECAGVSVAMGNACEELKALSDVVCESVKEDGIYHQFKRMGLI